MIRMLRSALVAVLVAGSCLAGAGVATADFENSSGTNQQDGDNSASTEQGGTAGSGDAVGGQVAGIVSSGDASVDARSRSEDVDIQTGAADGGNEASSFLGLNVSTVTNIGSIDEDFESSTGVNQQEGDNSLDLTQTADASSGDGVGGQVIGAVTSAGGSADVVADNASEDIDIETGNADAHNAAASFVGLNVSSDELEVAIAADFEFSTAANQQDGDNDASLDQIADSSSGDGVGGQVIGVVSAGDVSVDATNRSEDVEVDTGDAVTENLASSFVGLNVATETSIEIEEADFESSNATNQQEGDNSLDLSQTADASTGDGVGGQVIGVVTSAGGSADVVADNASEDIDVETGDAVADNEAVSFVGMVASPGETDVGIEDFEFSAATNQQDGDNALSGDQVADATSGDGVGGQVLGIVSAGDASLDARNRSEDVDLETGLADADNEAASFVGLNAASATTIESDFESSTAVNQLDGSNDGSFSQTANASSGDAVGGQVAGIVTSAGGSADAILDNASEDIDAESGESTFSNDNQLFVGLNFSTNVLFLGG